nr:hypothetical protein [Tanacetum cinerariifolium]
MVALLAESGVVTLIAPCS